MFRNATSFNQPIGNWNTGNVNTIARMFQEAQSFNQSFGNWDISSIVNTGNAFKGTTALSDTNKGKIHDAFSVNKNWNYDWSEFVEEDTNKDDQKDQNPPATDNKGKGTPLRIRKNRMTRRIK